MPLHLALASLAAQLRHHVTDLRHARCAYRMALRLEPAGGVHGDLARQAGVAFCTERSTLAFPDKAEVWYFVRDLTRKGVLATYDRVLKAAKGAAIATDTKHEIELITGVHAYLLNRPLTELIPADTAKARVRRHGR